MADTSCETFFTSILHSMSLCIVLVSFGKYLSDYYFYYLIVIFLLILITLAAYKRQILPKIKDKENENVVIHDPVIQTRIIGDISSNTDSNVLQSKKENAMLIVKKIQRFNIEGEIDEKYERAKEAKQRAKEVIAETLDTNITNISNKIEERKIDLDELKDTLKIEERYTKAKEIIGNRIRIEKKRWYDTSSTSSENEEKPGSSMNVRRRKKVKSPPKENIRDLQKEEGIINDEENTITERHLQSSSKDLTDESFNVVELEEVMTKTCMKKTGKHESKVDKLLRFKHEQKSNLLELKDSLQIENKYMKVKEGIGKTIDEKKRRVGLKTNDKSEQSVSYKGIVLENSDYEISEHEKKIVHG